MTNQEAIKELVWVKKRGFVADKGIIGTDRIVKACNMAIEALENCPPEDSICYGCHEDCKKCETMAMCMI